MIPDGHPLQELFQELVSMHYDEDLGLRDPEMNAYIASMLCEFCESEHLFKIRTAEGRPLTDIGEMLVEADPVYGPAPSFDRERQVRKHIGDVALFFTGMFPESINHWRLRRQRLENFVDIVRAGRESYYVVSKFDLFEYAKVAPLFSRLAENFESCVYGLNLVKTDLQEMQHPIIGEYKQKSDDLVM